MLWSDATEYTVANPVFAAGWHSFKLGNGVLLSPDTYVVMIHSFEGNDTETKILKIPQDCDKGTYYATGQLTAKSGNNDGDLLLRILLENRAPEIANVKDTIYVTEGLSYSQTITATDADGDVLTLAALTLPSWLTFTDNGGGKGTLAGIVPAAVGMAYEVVITATDPEKASDKENFTVIIQKYPDPIFITEPVLNVNQGQPYSYTAKAINVYDDAALTVDDKSAALPEGITATSNADGSLTLAGTPTVPGEYTIKLQASFSVNSIVNRTVTQTFDIEVYTNIAPVIDPLANERLYVGEAYMALASATDINGDPLTFSLTGPEWLSIDAATGEIMGTPDASGEYEVTVSVSDGSLSDEVTYTITVIADNTPPVFDTHADETAVVGVAKSIVVTATDADGDALYITGINKPTWLRLVSNNNTAGAVTLIGTPEPAHVGTSVVELQVSDGVDVGTLTFNVTVAANQAPSVSLNLPGLSVGDVESFTIDISDPEGDWITFKALAVPAWIDYEVIRDASGKIVAVECVAMPTEMNVVDGDDLVEVEVTDGYNVVVVSETINFDIDPLGINDLEAMVKVYPNPAADYLKVENAANTTVVLYNVLGQVVFSTGINSSLETLDVSRFNKGTYMLKIISGDQSVVKSIVLQ
jgi:hypothetical protein